jgi:hypothetical protein
MPWKFGPCWRVQEALDHQGIAYDVAGGPKRPKDRAASWYRHESKTMALAINEGCLIEKRGPRAAAAR